MTRYFEDYQPGEPVELGTFSVSADEIIEFARQFDPQPFHLDPEAARESMFGELVASGWHTTALTMRQIVDHNLDPGSSMGPPGVDELRWLAPLRPERTMTVTSRVLDTKASTSRPDRGRVRSEVRVTDPDGAAIMTMVATTIVRRRP